MNVHERAKLLLQDKRVFVFTASRKLQQGNKIVLNAFDNV